MRLDEDLRAIGGKSFEPGAIDDHVEARDLTAKSASPLRVRSISRGGDDIMTSVAESAGDMSSDLIQEVAARRLDRNKKHVEADWQFTTNDARVKLKSLYPQFLT